MSQQIIVIVDPIHAGHSIGLHAQKRGFQIIPIFTLPRYMVSEQIFTDFNLSLYHFESELAKVLRVIEYEKQILGGDVEVVASIPGSEPGVELSIEIADALGLPHNKPTAKGAFRNKISMRQTLRNAGVKQPQQQRCDSEKIAIEFATKIGFPVIMKPPLGAGNDHVYKCNDAAEVKQCFYKIVGERDIFEQSTSYVVVEEFIQGSEYMVDLFGLGDGRYSLMGVWVYEKTDDFVCISTKSLDPNQDLIQPLVAHALDCTRALGVAFGPVHCEVCDDPERGPYLIEAGVRFAGVRITDLYLDRGGDNIFDLLIEVYTQGKLDNLPDFGHYKPAAVLQPQIGVKRNAEVVQEIHGIDEIQMIESVIVMENSLQVGSVLSGLPSPNNEWLLIAMSHHNEQKLEQAVSHALELLHVIGDALPSTIEMLLQEGFPPNRILMGRPPNLRYHENITEFHRNVPAVISPRNTDDIKAALRAARQSQGELQFFPISTGKNWSLGSKLPNRDGCILMDLGGIAELKELNEHEGYVIVSPGTLWGGVSEYLEVHSPQWFVNPLGGYGGTSLMGNCLDRGDGTFGLRADGVMGLEVMLADGTVVPVGGFWQQYNQEAVLSQKNAMPSHYYSTGVGPGLLQAFLQSNFGIAISMVYRLHRRGERTELVWGTFPRSQLTQLANLTQQFIHSKLIDKNCSRLGFELPDPDGEDEQEPEEGLQGITSIGRIYFNTVISGDSDLVELQSQKVVKALRMQELQAFEVSSLKVTPQKLNCLEGYPLFVRMVANLAYGRPNWTRIAALYPEGVQKHRYFLDADETPVGMVCFLPAIPVSSPGHVEQAVTLIEEICIPRNLRPIIGIEMTGIALVMIPFDRTDHAATENAKACKQELYKSFLDRGYFPHRVDIEEQAHIASRLRPYFDLVARFKKAIDPDEIIAPGRYSLPP